MLCTIDEEDVPGFLFPRVWHGGEGRARDAEDTGAVDELAG